MITLYLNGFLIGVLASMPIGALAIFSIQRTLSKGLKYGFLVGVGAATGDFLYATVAAFSVSYIADFLLENELIIGSLGSLLLIFMGIKIYRSDTLTLVKQYKKTNISFSEIKVSEALKDFFSSFLLALSNPVTILGFGALFATFGVSTDLKHSWYIFILLGGIYSGAIFWWFLVSFVVNKLRKKFSLKTIVMINRIAGIIIVIFGIFVLFFILFIHPTNVEGKIFEQK